MTQPEMLNEDKLTQEQRLRLEALNQAVVCRLQLYADESAEKTIERAAAFEDYIRNGKNETTH